MLLTKSLFFRLFFVYVFFCIPLESYFQHDILAQSIFSNDTQIIEINDNTSYLNLGYNIQYLEDRKHNIQISDIISGRMEGKFFNNNSDIINLGFSKSTYWIRFIISTANQESNDIDWLLKAGSPLLEHVELYLYLSNKEYVKINSKENGIFKNIQHEFKKNFFSIKTKPKETLNFLLKVKADAPMQVPIELYTFNSYIKNNLRLNFHNGISFGMMTILFCLNVFMFYYFKDKIFLYNTMLILSLTVFENIFNGFIFELIPKIIYEDNLLSKLDLLLSISIFSVCFAMTILNRLYIKYKFNNNVLLKLHTFFLYCSVSICIISMISSSSLIIKLPMIFLPINTSFLLISFVLILKKEDDITRLIIISFLPFFISISMISIASFGLFSVNSFISYLLQFSSIFMGFMLSITLLKHINIVKETNRKADNNDISLKLKALNCFHKSLENIQKLSNKINITTSEYITKYEDTNKKKVHIIEHTDSTEKNIDEFVLLIQEVKSNVNEISPDIENIIAHNTVVENSIDDMTVSITDIQENVLNSSSLTEKALSMAKSVITSIKNFSITISTIVEITEEIKKIAERIDILAVNAAIEAASAGEAGKGFSVVANEIAKFAEQSAGAADDISDQIFDANLKAEKILKMSNDFSVIIDKLNNFSLHISDNVKKHSITVNKISSEIHKVKTKSNNISSFSEKSLKYCNEFQLMINEISRESKIIFQYINEVNQMITDNNKHSALVVQTSNEISKLTIINPSRK
ncbi:membrane protein containing Diverse 7TM receptor, extracellular region 2 [Candidatus Magnetomorum sp. HK-1]|nr:membrane protein containing Diverse 7TM receptor, extracellular region 2 [Candidatus Magnetomorum sp. HK-1]